MLIQFEVSGEAETADLHSLASLLRVEPTLAAAVQSATEPGVDSSVSSVSMTVTLESAQQVRALVEAIEDWLRLQSGIVLLKLTLPDGTRVEIHGSAETRIHARFEGELAWSDVTSVGIEGSAIQALTGIGVSYGDLHVWPAGEWSPRFYRTPDDYFGATARTPDSYDDLAMPVTIYLSDGSAHEQVEAAVIELLAQADLHVERQDDPIIGSWFRRLWAGADKVARSDIAREGALTAVHVADARLVLSQDAVITATLLQNLAPVIAALQPTKDAAVRVGALLIVKVDWVVNVVQLTAAQQALLDHRPSLAMSPHQIIEALDLVLTSEHRELPATQQRADLTETQAPMGRFR
jgi:Effector Associated Constant Component 1